MIQLSEIIAKAKEKSISKRVLDEAKKEVACEVN